MPEATDKKNPYDIALVLHSKMKNRQMRIAREAVKEMEKHVAHWEKRGNGYGESSEWLMAMASLKVLLSMDLYLTFASIMSTTPPKQ
jgi:hypothetical protein